MSIASEITRLSNAKAALKTSIESKGVTVPSATKLDGYSALVDAIEQGGGTPASFNDVNFYDYDGTIVASYSAAEIANMTALPDNPSHPGLTAQGWNWPLGNIKNFVATYGKLDIGQMYITDDGKTRLYITLIDRRDISLCYYQSVASGVTVDWGDGNTTEAPSTGNSTISHTYTSPGNYIITLNKTSGDWKLGKMNNEYNVFNNTILGELKKVELGGSISCSAGTFRSCYCLSTITIPQNASIINSENVFHSCRSLRYCVIPNGSEINKRVFYSCTGLLGVSLSYQITTLQYAAFYNAGSLFRITLPSSILTIGDSAFQYNNSLSYVKIGTSITTIVQKAFQYCNSIKYFIITRTSPPSLGNADAFSNIASDARIVVPTSAVATYKAASNWSSLSSIIIGGAENY